MHQQKNKTIIHLYIYFITFASSLYIYFIILFTYCTCSWKQQDSGLSLLSSIKFKNTWLPLEGGAPTLCSLSCCTSCSSFCWICCWTSSLFSLSSFNCSSVFCRSSTFCSWTCRLRIYDTPVSDRILTPLKTRWSIFYYRIWTPPFKNLENVVKYCSAVHRLWLEYDSHHL